MTARPGSQPASHAPRSASHEQSERAFQRARRVFPGGTTRMTIAKDPCPIYMAQGEGFRLTDIDGNSYVDFHNDFAVLIHGHAFAPVVEAVTRQIQLGTCFANPTLSEIELAETLCERFPGAQQLRFCNSGTEAVMFAIKAARAFTGRRKIAKLEGAFHGLYDWAEVSEASRPENWGPPGAPHATPLGATPAAVLEEVVPLPFNFIDETRQLIRSHSHELAAILICLMPSRAGLIPLDAAYVQMLREETARHGILLIDDEVLNGRLTYAGAAGRYGLEPDLVTLGKIIGGGLPIGAVAGRREVMAVFDNTGRDPLVPHAGTFSANPLSMVAGQAAMRALTREAIERLNALGERLRNGVADAAQRLNAPFSVTGLGSAFKIHPRKTPPRHYREAWLDSADTARLTSLWRDLLESGFLFASHGLGVLSTPMNEDVIDSFIDAFARSAARHTP